MLADTDLKDYLYIKPLTNRNKLLLILAIDSQNEKNGSRIRELGRNAGLSEIHSWNITNMLSKLKPKVIKLPGGWILTSLGREHVKSLGVLPDKRNPKVVDTLHGLRELMSAISDDQTVEFLNEAIACFEYKLYRACVVLSWVGAVAMLHERVIKNHLTTFNVEAKKRNDKWKNAKTKDDLTRMKESDFLDLIAVPPLSIIGNDAKKELKNCLDLRNSCGHPNSLQIAEHKVTSHLEILVLNVFQHFV